MAIYSNLILLHFIHFISGLHTFYMIRKTGTPERMCLGLQLDKLKFENLDYCDAEQAFNILHRTLLDLLDAYCPKKKVRLSGKDPSFMTAKPKCLLNKKYKLKKKGRNIDSIELVVKDEIKNNLTGNKRMGRKDMGQSSKDDPDSLNDYFAEICTATIYREPIVSDKTQKETPYFNLNQIYEGLKRIRKTACGPNEILFLGMERKRTFPSRTGHENFQQISRNKYSSQSDETI